MHGRVDWAPITMVGSLMKAEAGNILV